MISYFTSSKHTGRYEKQFCDVKKNYNFHSVGIKKYGQGSNNESELTSLLARKSFGRVQQAKAEVKYCRK